MASCRTEASRTIAMPLSCGTFNHSMSRSAFAARFTELVGESAMRYLTRWRMQAAEARLRNEDVTVAEVALSLGYESEAAFNRAFKRHIGVSPGAVKKPA